MHRAGAKPMTNGRRDAARGHLCPAMSVETRNDNSLIWKGPSSTFHVSVGQPGLVQMCSSYRRNFHRSPVLGRVYGMLWARWAAPPAMRCVASFMLCGLVWAGATASYEWRGGGADEVLCGLDTGGQR